MVICDLASAFYAIITCAHCPRQTLASYTLEWLYSQTSFRHLCQVSWHLLPLLQETRTIYHSPLLSVQPTSHLPRELICKSPKEMSTPATIHDFIHVYDGVYTQISTHTYIHMWLHETKYNRAWKAWKHFLQAVSLFLCFISWYCAVLSCSDMSDSLWPHGL